MEIFKSSQSDESQWLPISDLMSVLMMVFLLIAISYMLKVSEEKEKIEQIAITYNKLQKELYVDLYNEFKDDLIVWNATIDSNTLSIKFNSPEILFSVGSANIKPKFQSILDNFAPRFMRILYGEKYKHEIEEIRIEGHTSSTWNAEVSEDIAYIYNMKLSQDRTRNVLFYIIQKEKDKLLLEWIKKNVTANGLSSSKLIYNSDNTQNKQKSRRVEFRVKTNSERTIGKIVRSQ